MVIEWEWIGVSLGGPLTQCDSTDRNSSSLSGTSSDGRVGQRQKVITTLLPALLTAAGEVLKSLTGLVRLNGLTQYCSHWLLYSGWPY